jgi:hypothetical protein
MSHSASITATPLFLSLLPPKWLNTKQKTKRFVLQKMLLLLCGFYLDLTWFEVLVDLLFRKIVVHRLLTSDCRFLFLFAESRSSLALWNEEPRWTSNSHDVHLKSFCWWWNKTLLWVFLLTFILYINLGNVQYHLELKVERPW